MLARAHQNLIWARTRHTNGLRSALREYYPAALEAFDDLADRDALAILGRAPTPTDAGRLSLSKIRLSAQSRWAPTQPGHPAHCRFKKCCAPSSSPHPPRSPPHSGPAPALRSASSPNSTARSASSKRNLADTF